VTEGSQELARVTEEVFDISQDARVGLASTAELYQRIARSAEQLGISQQRVLDVTRSVSKAITISGVSATSATAAIVQLGQGLASGTLRGDELRSVLEQTPRLARAIADGLQVPIGALRELGKAGKLTAEDVIRALESQKDVLEEEFGDINVTVGQAFTQLENSVIRFLGRFGDATGIFSNFAKTVQLVSSNIDGLGESFFESAFEVSQFISALAGGFSLLGTQVDLFIAETQGKLSALFSFEFKNLDQLFDLENTQPDILDLSGMSQQAKDEIAILEAELLRAQQVVADGLDAQRVEFERRREERRAAAALDITEDPDPSGFAKPDPKAEKAAEKLRKEMERLGKSLTESVQTPLEEFQDSVRQMNMLLDAGTISTETYQRALNVATEKYREALPEVQLYNEQIERGKDITESVLTPQEIYNRTLKELTELLGIAAITQETFNRALLNAQDELEDALTKNDEFAKFLEQVSIQAARNMQSAFADFLFDPFKDGLDGLRQAFSDTLRRMAAEALSAEVFRIMGEGLRSASGGGSGGGGFLDFIGSALLGSFAEGGDFTGRRPTRVGGQGPESITPRASGTVIPNEQASAESSPVNVTVPVTNIVDPQGAIAAIESSRGSQAILNVISQNPDAIKRVLN
jgi:tape measure domain-containing protein